jgi:L-aspartate oxidase
MIAGELAVGSAQWHRRADVIVVGSGAAGLSAALPLINVGKRVTVITKGRLGDGCTAWAQGGLAAVIDPADSFGGHIRDTMVAGAGISEPAAVAELVAAAPGAIRQLARLGARFDREPGGTLALGLEGGHHARRIVHAGGDASGAEIARVLAAAVMRAADHGRATVLEGALAVDALRSADDAVCGLRLIEADGTIGELHADAVVLATGGIGQAWPVTSNPSTATGDGLALALRAGALIRDAEFVQFHPTVLVPPAGARRPGDRRALISEALRGEGARLIDLEGTPIMTGVHPLGDLAPRDVVAAAIHRRMVSTGADHVLLDATGFDAEAWRHHFPTIFALCAERGVDPRVEPIPVAPAEHYSCGGVLADLDGVTSVPGLYAVGEVASTGVQGANRLASNSLTEALIAGRRVADRLSRVPPRRGVAADRGRWPLLSSDLRPKVLAATERGSGVLRHNRDLRGQLTALTELTARAGRVDGDAISSGLRADVETTNLHTVSSMIATAALNRTESRGCHRRSDYPEPRGAWRRHQILQLRDGDLQQLPAESREAA